MNATSLCINVAQNALFAFEWDFQNCNFHHPKTKTRTGLFYSGSNKSLISFHLIEKRWDHFMFFRNDSNKLTCATMVWRSTQRGDSLSEGASLLVAAVFLNSWHNKIIGNTSMYKIIPMLLWNGFHPIVSRPNLKATAPSSISSIKILMERSSRKRKKKRWILQVLSCQLSGKLCLIMYIALHYCTLSVYVLMHSRFR